MACSHLLQVVWIQISLPQVACNPHPSCLPHLTISCYLNTNHNSNLLPYLSPDLQAEHTQVSWHLHNSKTIWVISHHLSTVHLLTIILNMILTLSHRIPLHNNLHLPWIILMIYKPNLTNLSI